MIKALFKFDKHIPKDAVVVDTTSGTHPTWKQLSPFILPAPPAKNFENLWQFSKVYKKHVGADGFPTQEWWEWKRQGFADPRAHRYPMKKGAIPEYSYWDGWRLDYISARKEIYIPEYTKNVRLTESFMELSELYYDCLHFMSKDLILLDYDAYDHQALGMTLKDVVNDPSKKCGHAFVLVALLTGEPMV